MDTLVHHCRVAVVDDDEAILDAIHLVLQSHGWCVRTYTSGQAFLADLNRHRPDCLLLEPHVTGVRAVAIARSIAHGSGRIPIIGLTARPASAQTMDLVDVGLHAMLTKPVTAESLFAHIHAATGQLGR